MSENPGAGNSKAGRKSKPTSSKAADGTKASNRAPPRVTTMQKLRLRLYDESIALQRAKGIVSRGVSPRQAAGNPSEIKDSRESSPGIDNVPPPVEPKAVPEPPSPPKKQDVKRTAAQILRELVRCKAEQDAEIRRISALEFVASPEEVVNKSAVQLEEREAVARAERRLLALLSLENSIASRDRALAQKKKIGTKALEEKRQLRRLLAELRSQERSIGDQVRDAVRRLRERCRQAKVAAIQQRAAQAKVFGEETLAMVQEAKQQKEQERQDKALLIHQIRQLESVSVPHVKEVDLTETAGHGLLAEMSIVELNERLALLKMEHSTELKEKNQKILDDKRMQQEQMEIAEDVLTRFHKMQATRRQHQRELAAHKPPPVTSERLQQLARELQEKRSIRLRLAAQRRLCRSPQRWLLEPTVAPLVAKTQSASAGRSGELAQTEDRRCRSDTCVRLGQQALSVGENQPD